jgi:hypothetical protein
MRSMSEFLDRSIPVWVVMRPTRFPRHVGEKRLDAGADRRRGGARCAAGV